MEPFPAERDEVLLLVERVSEAQRLATMQMKDSDGGGGCCFCICYCVGAVCGALSLYLQPGVACHVLLRRVQDSMQGLLPCGAWLRLPAVHSLCSCVAVTLRLCSGSNCTAVVVFLQATVLLFMCSCRQEAAARRRRGGRG